MEFLFISDSSVRTRYALVSYVPFRAIGSTFSILKMIDAGDLGYYEFLEKSVFCVKHINEYQLNADGYTVKRFDESSSKFMVIHNEKSAFEQMTTVCSRLRVVCDDDNDPWSSVYSSPDIDHLTSVEVKRFPANINAFAKACGGYNVIVFRKQTLTDSILSFLAELTLVSDSNARSVIPVVLCYLSNIGNLNYTVSRICAPYTWGCSSDQQYRHFLTGCIVSKNNKMLLEVLGTSFF